MAAAGVVWVFTKKFCTPLPKLDRYARPQRWDKAGRLDMTRDEILAQAKVGGFAIVRLEIANFHKDGSVSVFHPACQNTRWHSLENEIIAIEPPPETDAEKIARLEARVAELEAQALPNPAKRGK
jgi:hypothetical protein